MSTVSFSQRLYSKEHQKYLKKEDIRKYFDYKPLKKSSKSTSSPVSSSSTISPGNQSSETRKKSSTNEKITYTSKTGKKIELVSFLPTDVQNIVLEQLIKNNTNGYELRSWVIKDKLIFKELLNNPNAVNYLDQNYNLNADLKSDWDKLVRNPNAIELIKKKILYEKDPKVLIKEKIYFASLSVNPNALDLIVERLKEERADPKKSEDLLPFEKVSWFFLSSNPHPLAIKLLGERILEEERLIKEDKKKFDELFFLEKIDWKKLSSNPNAIELLKANKEKIEWSYFIKNKNIDVKLLEELIVKQKNGEKLKKNEEIEIYHLWTIPKATRIVLKYYNKEINYGFLSDNTSFKAIELLTKQAIDDKKIRDYSVALYNQLPISKKIHWPSLSSNPKAIQLLTAKAMEEKEMLNKKPYEFKLLQPNDKINWKKLSANPKAIKLLEMYPENIDLSGLCQNPNAVKLIRKNIKLFSQNDWEILSANPCIFKKI
jgi:hypothetical protein